MILDINTDLSRLRYRNLQKVNRPVALKTFEKYKDFYHPICRGMVEKDLFGKKDK